MRVLCLALLLVVQPTQMLVEIDGPAQATQPAVRLDPPTTTTTLPTFATDCDEMHWYRVNAGLPDVFDRLGWRESNCRQELGVHTSCCWGWLQLNIDLHLRDHRLVDRYHTCGVFARTDADGPEPWEKAAHMCAAKALYDLLGLQPWRT